MSKQPQINAKLDLDNSSMRNALGRSKKDVGGFAKYAKSSLGTAFKAATLAAGGIMAGVAFGIKKNSEIESTQIALKSFMGSAQKAKDAIAMLRQEAMDRPIFSTSEIMETGKAMATLAGGDINKLKNLVQITEKLSLLAPEHGLSGAAFSLKEMSSWDYTSIVDKYNLSKKRLLELKALGMEGTQAVAKILTEMGISDATMDDFGNSFSGMIATIKSSAEQFAVEISKGLFEDLKPKLEELKTFLGDHKQAIQEAATGIATALSTMMELSVKTTEVAGVASAQAGGFVQSLKDSNDRGEINYGGAASGMASLMGNGFMWGADKVGQGIFSGLHAITGKFIDDYYIRSIAEGYRDDAAKRAEKFMAANDAVDKALTIDKASQAGKDAAAKKAEEYLPPAAQLGPGVTNRKQQATLQVNVASSGYVPPMTAGSV